MQQRTLGATGVKVSKFALGSMMFGEDGNPVESECARIVNAAVDAGVTLIDTADTYSGGQAEEFIGRALQGRRDEIVLATKFWGPMGPGPNEGGASRLWITREVEASLRRLQTDHIDLYQVHRPDFGTDLEELLSTLTDLVRQGKIRYFGCSTFPAWRIVEAHWVSDRRGLMRFVSEQPPYSILVRGVEEDVLPVAQRLGMGTIVWSPLAGGWLTGKYKRDAAPAAESRAVRASKWEKVNPLIPQRFQFDRPGNQEKLAVVEQLQGIAAEAGISLMHMAMAFCLAHPAVTSAIMGPRTVEQLEGLLAGADIELGQDVLDAIDAAAKPGVVIEEADRGWIPPWLPRGAV